VNHRHCAYCASNNATTRDHVIPKSLYPASIADDKIQLLTVPACPECNRSFMKDEQEFLAYITAGANRSPATNALLHEKVLPSMHHPRATGARSRLMTNFQETDSFSSGGIWIGTRMEVKLPELFWRVIRKIVRGLYFHHTRECIQPDTSMFIYDFLDKDVQNDL